MITAEMRELHRSITTLRHHIVGLRAHYGDTDAVRRMANDLDRLEIDLHDFEHSPPKPIKVKAKEQVVYVPDSKSDEAAWLGAQDEGLGFHSRERTK
ncbi:MULTISPECIES: hypothetical protein [Gordonia]|uniref:Uncharacterized protein n=1 Tax=Gordonia amicalis TaxID=89053 RepID=A0AAE4R8U8_9ACTN|nr:MULTISPECIES: hypothetical protein [Gordonia]ATD71308.1 hypothetical protein CNO18_14640 [Gordonia sp. 1D]KAF0968288.1 hypothetical protein BPODLACK_03229 [Gordonia sp. YY1]MCZ0912674.1 hypothetical protein [Gordonia amicalis]MCZ4580595.1 hypothetical protein [Gordonia amicalis]MCZ4652170.1 hypothetical protein [Gordonia amicalis]